MSAADRFGDDLPGGVAVEVAVVDRLLQEFDGVGRMDREAFELRGEGLATIGGFLADVGADGDHLWVFLRFSSRLRMSCCVTRTLALSS